MIPELCSILCSVIPFKKLRRRARMSLTKILTDYRVDNGAVYPLTTMARSEYAPMNSLIGKSSRVLVVAPHPDDESIALGGILAKYSRQCDVFCVSSSGYKRPSDAETAEEIADIRIGEFHAALDALGIKKRWIVRIYGDIPHFDQMLAKMGEYKSLVDFSQYDVILLPDPLDAHREHQFVTNHLVPRLLQECGYKSTAVVGYYPVWGTVTAPNYFEDITDYVTIKENAILCYGTRMQTKDNLWERTKALNYFYGFMADYHTRYAEALHVEPIEELIKRPDNRNWARYM